MDQDQLDRIEQKLDRLLNALHLESGAGRGTRLPSEIKREAQATVLQFQAKRDKRRRNERADKDRE